MFNFQENNKECLITINKHHINALKFLKTTSNVYVSFENINPDYQIIILQIECSHIKTEKLKSNLSVGGLIVKILAPLGK